VKLDTRDVQRLRHDVRVAPYLRQARLFTSLNHVASRINGRITALAHFILDERFNQSLLFDLVARPAVRLPEVA
jgi:hypothetical protein